MLLLSKALKSLLRHHSSKASILWCSIFFMDQLSHLYMTIKKPSVQFSRSVVSDSFHQATLSLTNSQSLLKLMSIESMMPSNHLILCCPLLLLPSIFPSIRVYSSESVLRIMWPEYWNFSFSISPSSEYSGLIAFRMD